MALFCARWRSERATTCTSRRSATGRGRRPRCCIRPDGSNLMKLPILPTTMVGSYSMPGWLERLKTEYFARRITRHDLDEIHDTVVKAAVKDQEVAGLDIVTDGELRRDNMIDYFIESLRGMHM